MAPTIYSETQGLLLIFGFIMLVAILRAYRTYVGTRLKLGRTIFFTGFYFVFGSALVATSFVEGIPALYSIPNAIIFTLAAIWSYLYTDRRITFWRSSQGQLYLRGGVIIYLIWMLAIVARILIDISLIGPSALFFAPNQVLSGPVTLGLTMTDSILMLGIGLVVGRNVRVLQRYSGINSGREVVQVVN